MIERILYTLCFLFTFTVSQAGVIVLEGNYQGKNIYVQNPFAGSGVGFCVTSVYVNDDVTTDEWNSSAFEIDLSNAGLKQGEEVVIKINHKDDCRPKVLNPEVLKPKSTFKVEDITIAKDGTLKWKTTNESGKLPYVVEQYRWNKWVKVGEVQGKGTSGQNDYSFKVVPHSGENQFRVKQVDYTGKPKYSPQKKFRDPSVKEIDFNPKRVKDELTFTSETLYEIYDQYGNIVKKGFGDKVDCSNLEKGVYYLNYDNKTEKFMKK